MPYSTPSALSPTLYRANLSHPNTGGADMIIHGDFNAAMANESQHNELFQRIIDALDAAGIVVSSPSKQLSADQTVTVTP